MTRSDSPPLSGIDCLDLAEEGAYAAELMVSPVLQKTLRFRCDLPLAGLKTAPSIYIATNFVDTGGEVVVLIFRRNARTVVELKFEIIASVASALTLLRLWDWRDEFCGATVIFDFLRRLPIPI